MLHFFYTYAQLPSITTPKATKLYLRSAERFRGQVIPFRYLYVSSQPYFRKIKSCLPEETRNTLQTMNPAQVNAVKAHASFPKLLQDLGDDAIEKIKATFAEQAEVNIVVINGIGTGYGDNYVGLGVMQRMQELLAPLTVNFHLMQRMNERVAPVYMREPNVSLYNNCLNLKQFFQMDYYINLTGMLAFPEFESLPLIRFMGHSFQVNKQSSVKQLQPKLRLDSFKQDSVKQLIQSRFEQQNKRPTVLFHPQASAPIRSMQKVYADKIILALIAYGFNVVTAISYGFKSDQFASIDDISTDIDDLLHIAACCDAVVSVGTVLYHLSAALNKPTILLPSVRADVESGNAMPMVKTWVPESSESLILDKHKGREEQDMAIVEKIWDNIVPEELAAHLLKMLQQLKIKEER